MKTRAFCFTWNNPPLLWSDTLDKLALQYYVGGKETAPTTGTIHIQGFLYAKHPVTLSGVRKRLPGMHIEAKVENSTFEQAIAYCKKEGDYIERGMPPKDPKKKGEDEATAWANSLESAKSGTFDLIRPDILIRYYGSLKRINFDYAQHPRQLTDTCGWWIYGASGCGKSTYARTLAVNPYPKPINKWWDGYTLQDVVIIDDVEPSQASWLGYFLKIWADRFPFIAERKGGSLTIRPRAIVVTSQYSISDVFSDKESHDAIKRRYRSYQFTLLAPLAFELIKYVENYV